MYGNLYTKDNHGLLIFNIEEIMVVHKEGFLYPRSHDVNIGSTYKS